MYYMLKDITLFFFFFVIMLHKQIVVILYENKIITIWCVEKSCENIFMCLNIKWTNDLNGKSIFNKMSHSFSFWCSFTFCVYYICYAITVRFILKTMLRTKLPKMGEEKRKKKTKRTERALLFKHLLICTIINSILIKKWLLRNPRTCHFCLTWRTTNQWKMLIDIRTAYIISTETRNCYVVAVVVVA